MFNLQDLKIAWEIVKDAKAVGGIDNLSIDEFNKNAHDYLLKIHRKLINKTYVPQAYLLINIPKDRRETRKIALATVSDKIVQTAIKNRLEPVIDKTFADNSYAYRAGKGPLKALARVKHIITYEAKEWIGKCDIDNFFDTLNHELLFQKLKPFVPDEYMFDLIRMFVKMGYVDHNGKWFERSQGVPQGAVLSPLLSNLYLNELDHYANSQNMGYVRYADDFVILETTGEKARKSLKNIMQYIRQNLRLNLNPETYVHHAEQGFKFLGIWVTKSGLSLGTEKLSRLKNKINEAFQHRDFPAQYHETVTGIANYYGKLIPEHYLFPLDELIDRLWTHRLGNDSSLRSLKSIKKALEPLRYITAFNQNKRDYHLRRLARQIHELKKMPSGLTHKEVIRLRRREYEKKFTGLSHLHIGGVGKHIGKHKKYIRIREKNKPPQKIPFKNLKSISISGRAHMISSELIRYCAQNKISIDFVDENGAPLAKLHTARAAHWETWEKQFSALHTGTAIELASEIVRAKITNQLRLIKYFSKYARKAESDIAHYYNDLISTYDNLLDQLKESQPAFEKYRKIFMQFEAQAGSHYWHWFRLMTDEETDFTKREYYRATHPVNMMLNYGYGILYRYVWNSVIRQGLHPGFSPLHTPSKKEGTLIFDLIEPFRQPVVDRAVITLVNRKTPISAQKGKLPEPLKQKLINAVHQNLVRFDKYNGQRIRLYEIIEMQTLLFKQKLFAPHKKFKAYTIYKW